MRRSGILMHISSLPGPDGIGSLGREAFEFVDFLKAAGAKLWQVLPVGPVGYGESPYQSSSVFAGNPMLISLARLEEEGLLGADPAPYVDEDPATVDYDRVRPHKEARLRQCYAESAAKLADEIAAFRQENAAWLEDFALFTAVKRYFDNVMWTKWPDEDIRMHRPESVALWRERLADEVEYHIFVQYLFRRQWFALKQYANDNGISLFGDMPIYVAEDSADTWTHPEVFQLDENRVPRKIAGVPPDYFSADGQLWGNPLYAWSFLRLHGFGWWVERMKGMMGLFDLVRIDHFIGFANYYAVPHGAPNAKSGMWIEGPGYPLFAKLEKEIPGMKIIAEDLGEVSPRVKQLLADVGYPGMRVMCFGFGAGDGNNNHRPDNYVENCVVYPGTHDNDTVLGWVEAADNVSLKEAKTFLKFRTKKEAPWAFIKGAFASVADTAVASMQDVLALGTEARMNTPGTIGTNWRWRMVPGAATKPLAAKLNKLNKETNRL